MDKISFGVLRLFISYEEFITLLSKMLRSSRNKFIGAYLLDKYQNDLCIKVR
jgi:hypothetical protein